MVVVVNDPATTEIYTYGHTLSLHDALPISESWVSRSGNPRRKLAHTWELARAAGGLVGINTGHPNALVEEAIARDAIPELAGYPARRREVRSGQGSRVDLLLTGAGRPDCYVAVKTVDRKRGV